MRHIKLYFPIITISFIMAFAAPAGCGGDSDESDRYSFADDNFDPDCPDCPVITSVQEPQVVINGSTALFKVQFDDRQGKDTVQSVIAFQQNDTEEFVSEIENPAGGVAFKYFTIGKDLTDSMFGMGLSVEDADGNRSSVYLVEVPLIATGVGDIKVSLTFDLNVDLDLHVIDPHGEEIFYGHPTSLSGGELDLDSNPACDIDSVNNENVFWATGTAPDGMYTVKVDYWSACAIDPVNYTVTVMYLDAAEVYFGDFTASQADNGGFGSGEFVCSFLFERDDEQDDDADDDLNDDADDDTED